jgi:16S rRNA U516 pseudouridylate synthase RsuA-like enzyme
MKEQNEQSGSEPVFPMRINKYLAMEGRGSRRDMDKLVEQGKVLINGMVALLGSKVNEGDKVEIRFRGIREKAEGQERAMERQSKRRRNAR